MQSAATLIVDPQMKVTINGLKVFVVIGSVLYIAYGIILLLEGEFLAGHEFDCHSKEFII